MQYKSNNLEISEINSFIHQAALDPHINLDSLNQICDVCKHFNFAGLCTNLIRIQAARKSLGKNKQTKLIAVIAFPFGDIPNSIKKTEAELAAEHGAEELDIVPNYLKLYEGKIDSFAEELAEIFKIGLPYRVILDSIRIPEEKLSLAIEASIDAGARGIQAGNGFGTPIQASHILKLRALIKNRCELKVAGGIKNLHQVLELVEAGASSIGTSVGADLAKQFKIYNHQN
ncbi:MULTISPECIES: deoxyribose-phosphate aldolase [Prochlorococcus]|uniref:Deoxyribose-phosphate aldolase n=1 Tax=Prochlorococcus marinus (strain SARG / CCMP1375 / SS120) TaxID=167539 RepID=Q7VDI0_PROMA|nr:MULTISPECIES: deoxyribose-phosphate aldolase [Prochlorococcus]AAP99442.1 Deoxyribose-phosphate aldolase [Prochlorococcus marinus subsp. marinus str. CCMP1375]KGG11289.1 Deoxyribose-phosphate aldolase [Prochlorococcus marinus str. LG]KGG18757.1 Deoxyribose-phosphate aldolase [Prochlorococcus marinus str. SS2]KGG23030.1 Deoxyribose-phosphate aldolase [Prochlorococcus marinus str. SS35]KGG33737.1 Deoxyribose-phosphate aldolase [Prochlorococcus marinus str. SS51]